MQATDQKPTVQAAQANPTDDWLTPRKLAEYLEVTEEALEQMRRHGTGPKFAKCGRLVRYRKSWIDLWLESRSFKSNAEARRAGIKR